MKVRAETEARVKRETTYQAALRSYTQILKPGMKRKEVEDYLRVNNTDFFQMSLDDVTKIGEDAPTWFCGPPGVYVKFQFTGVRPLENVRLWPGSVIPTGATLRLSEGLTARDPEGHTIAILNPRGRKETN